MGERLKNRPHGSTWERKSNRGGGKIGVVASRKSTHVQRGVNFGMAWPSRGEELQKKNEPFREVYLGEEKLGWWASFPEKPETCCKSRTARPMNYGTCSGTIWETRKELEDSKPDETKN